VPADANTAVVTDTTAYIPEELLAGHDIKQVSLYVSLDGEQRPEIEIAGDDYDDFFERLRASDEGATTSQPSVGDFCAVYEPLLADGKDVVSIHLSAGISGTCESAIQAKERLTSEGKGGERIRVYDSRSSCGGQALVVLAATAAAEAGADGAETLAAAERCRDGLQMWFAIDTLEYLRKGGRIGAAQAWLGSALQIKPILTLGEEITPVERVRTRRRAFERLVDYARQRRDEGADAWVVQQPVFVSEIGPVIGAHVGPGLLGVGGVSSSALRAD
jgi:DegV family protein with EDD domain